MCWTCDNPQATVLSQAGKADYEARMWDKIDPFGRAAWHSGFPGGRGGQPVLGRRAVGHKARP